MKSAAFEAPFLENRGVLNAEGGILEADSYVSQRLIASLRKAGVNARAFSSKEDLLAYAQRANPPLEVVSSDMSTLLPGAIGSDANYLKAVRSFVRELRAIVGEEVGILLYSTGAPFAGIALDGEIDQVVDKDRRSPSAYAKEMQQLVKLVRLRSLENEVLRTDANHQCEPLAADKNQTPAREIQSILARIRRHLSSSMLSHGPFDPMVSQTVEALQQLDEWPKIKISAFAGATWQTKIIVLLTLLSLPEAEIPKLLKTDLRLQQLQLDPSILNRDEEIGRRATLLLEIFSAVLKAANYAVYPLRWYWHDLHFYGGRPAPPWAEIGLGHYLLDRDTSELKRCSTWLRDH